MANHKMKLLGLVMLLVAASWALAGEPEPAAEAEDMANPQYEAWASFAVGATASMKMVSYDADGEEQMVMASSQTLTALDADSATVTAVSTMVVAGQEIENAPMETVVPARVAVPADQPEETPDMEIETEEGEETIEVPAGTFECTFVKTTMVMTIGENVMTTITTMWSSDAVPGGMVKMTSSTDSVMTKSTSVTELMEFTTGAE